MSQPVIQYIVEGYKNILVRLAVTIIVITITQILWRYKFTSTTQINSVVFQNLWLTCAYFVTTIVTGIMFIILYFRAENDVRDKGILGFFVFILFLAFTIISAFNLESESLFFFFLPIGFAAAVLIVDWQLNKAGLKGLQGSHWFSFDFAVLIGVSMVAILQYLNGAPNTASPNNLIYGFGAGATAFQLIMANIVFNPTNYFE